MPAHQVISSNYIIAKIIRDFRPTNSSWIHDSYEWIGDAIRGIGSYYANQEVGVCAQVKEYKVKLPCQLNSLLGIQYKGFKLSRNNSNSFHTPCKALANLNISSESYSLNPGYIHTSFEEGEIIIYMIGVPLDCNNLPLLPDLFDYLDAVSWYIVSRLALRGDVKFSFEDAEQRWETKRWEAKNRTDFPDIGDMEAFTRSWNSVLLDTSKPQKFMGEIGNIDNLNTYFPSETGNLIVGTP
jgi:hypothetical protein